MRLVISKEWTGTDIDIAAGCSTGRLPAFLSKGRRPPPTPPRPNWVCLEPRASYCDWASSSAAASKPTPPSSRPAARTAQVSLPRVCFLFCYCSRFQPQPGPLSVARDGTDQSDGWQSAQKTTSTQKRTNNKGLGLSNSFPVTAAAFGGLRRKESR